MEKTKKKFSYSDFHRIIFIIFFTTVLIYIFHRIECREYGDKLSILIVMAIFAVLQAVVQSVFYTLEKKDEMVQYNLSKANRIILCAVLIVLFGAVLVNDYLIKGLICSDFCWITVMSAISLRSFLFMCFDTVSNKDTEEE